jgi:hypothetical protein
MIGVNVSEPLMVSTSQTTQELRLSTTRFRISQYQPPQLIGGIFKCSFWLNGSFFGDDDLGF